MERPQIAVFQKKLHLTYRGMVLYAVLSMVSMATMNIGAVILVCCLFMERGGIQRFFADLQELSEIPLFRNYSLVSIILGLACFLSLASAYWYPLNFDGHTLSSDWFKDLLKLWYFPWPIFLWIGWRRLSEGQQATVLKSWFLTFGILSWIGLLQIFSGWPRFQPNPLLPGFFHPTLFLGHHLSVANIWIFPFFALLEFIVSKKRRDEIRIPKSILLIFLISGFLVLIFTYSRTLWFALPIGLGHWILKKGSFKKVIFSLCALCFFTAFMLKMPLFEQRLKNHMGIEERVSLWKANLEFFKNRPIFGVGFLKNQELSGYYFQSKYPDRKDFFIGHAHNVYLEVLAGLGGFGFLAWLLWIGWFFMALKQGGVESKVFSFYPGLSSAWIVFLVNGLTQVNFWEGKVLHQIMWIVGMTLHCKSFKKSCSPRIFTPS